MSAPVAVPWDEANARYWKGQVRRLRLLLRRRFLWLRRNWQSDPLKEYADQVISDARADWLLREADVEAEALFYYEDEGAAEITRALAELEQNLGEMAAAMAGTPPALEWLARLFGLGAFERDVLLLAAAPGFDPDLAPLYGYAQDDVARTYATPHLAAILFAPEQTGFASQEAFAPQAPLRRFGLVQWEGRPTDILGIDERIWRYLRGSNLPDDRLVDLARPLPAVPLAAPHRELADRLAAWVRTGSGRGPSPVLVLLGSRGTGKRAVARALCDRIGWRVLSVDIRRLLAPGSDLREQVRLLEREAILQQAAIYLDIPELEMVAAGSLDRILDHLTVFVVLGAVEPPQVERETLVVRLPRLGGVALAALWRQALAGVPHSVDGQFAGLAQQFELGSEAIVQVVASARDRARLRAAAGTGSDIVTANDLWETCRERAAWRLEELAQRLEPCFDWDDIVLPPDVLAQLREIVAQVAGRHRVYEEWGFGAKLTRGRGISALFSGPSGTGKTMAAEILANALNLDLYRIDLAGVINKYIGETEKNLKRVFEAAERSGAILFFDEADALFGKRTEVRDAHDRYANIEVNYLLQRMEDYRGLAILATNRKSDLDRAFLRRLRFLVDFPFPDADARRRIWHQVFPCTAQTGPLNYDWLARLEITGGSIRNIALSAAFLAADDAKPIAMEHIAHAARREYAKLDKLLTQDSWGGMPAVR